MKTSHKLILAFCKTVMVFSASIFVASTILLNVVLRPESIKLWVSDSGLYEVSAREIQSQIKQNFSGSAADNPLVDEAIKQAITPERLQSTGEKGIDSSFSWLRGGQAEPRFELNEAEIRTSLSAQVITGLRERVNQLPACSLQNPPLTTDIFTINCLPPGTNIEASLTQVRAEITQSTELNSTSDATDGPSIIDSGTQANSQDIVSQLQGYRQAYQLLQMAPLLAAILFIASLVITLIFIKPKYRILRTLGLVCIPQAVLYLIAGWLTPGAVRSSSEAILSQSSNTPFAEPVQSITLAIAQAVSSSFTQAGVIIGVAGVMLLILYFVVNNKFKTRIIQKPEPVEPNNSTPSSW